MGSTIYCSLMISALDYYLKFVFVFTTLTQAWMQLRASSWLISQAEIELITD